MTSKYATYVATTPSKLSSQIQEFCQTLEPSIEPMWLDTEPADWAVVGHCYSNVDALIGDDGEAEYGWVIWEFPDIYLTAEYHAVAKIDGRLVDPTPQIHGERKVLFLPSKCGRPLAPVVNKYMPASRNRLCRRICELQRQQCILQNRGGLFGAEWQSNDRECVFLFKKFLDERQRRRRVKAQRRGK